MKLVELFAEFSVKKGTFDAAITATKQSVDRLRKQLDTVTTAVTRESMAVSTSMSRNAEMMARFGMATSDASETAARAVKEVAVAGKATSDASETAARAVKEVAVAGKDVTKSLPGPEAAAQVAASMGTMEKANKSLFATLMATDVALGRGSIATKLTKTMMGGGYILAAGIIAKQIENISKQVLNLADASGKGELTWAQAKAQFVESIPIVGSLAVALDNLLQAYDNLGKAPPPPRLDTKEGLALGQMVVEAKTRLAILAAKTKEDADQITEEARLQEKLAAIREKWKAARGDTPDQVPTPEFDQMRRVAEGIARFERELARGGLSVKEARRAAIIKQLEFEYGTPEEIKKKIAELRTSLVLGRDNLGDVMSALGMKGNNFVSLGNIPDAFRRANEALAKRNQPQIQALEGQLTEFDRAGAESWMTPYKESAALMARDVRRSLIPIKGFFQDIFGKDANNVLRGITRETAALALEGADAQVAAARWAADEKRRIAREMIQSEVNLATAVKQINKNLAAEIVKIRRDAAFQAAQAVGAMNVEVMRLRGDSLKADLAEIDPWLAEQRRKFKGNADALAAAERVAMERRKAAGERDREGDDRRRIGHIRRYEGDYAGDRAELEAEAKRQIRGAGGNIDRQRAIARDFAEQIALLRRGGGISFSDPMSFMRNLQTAAGQQTGKPAEEEVRRIMRELVGVDKDHGKKFDAMIKGIDATVAAVKNVKPGGVTVGS